MLFNFEQMILLNNKKNIKSPSHTKDLLKETRIKQGVSLKEAAECIGVSVKYLERIEEGDYNNLPADVYVRGFLKKYAEFLGLPVQEIVDFYQKEKRIFYNIYNNDNVEKKSFNGGFFGKIYITPKAVSFFAIVAAVIFIVSYFIYEVGFLVSPPNLIMENPVQDAEVFESKINVIGRTDYDSFVKINGQNITVDENGYFNKEINLSDGVNVLEIKAVNRLGKEASIIKRLVYTENKN
ncbi:MAG: hypothetical protein US76_00555 [Parcubacteria group bacterium GW2011_GWA2_38_13b]|nr:MAG: hypothetical protein US76_00555 [Parcubacteria group bacterium GW2011_GWA2_38_13b]